MPVRTLDKESLIELLLFLPLVCCNLFLNTSSCYLQLLSLGTSRPKFEMLSTGGMSAVGAKGEGKALWASMSS